MILINPKIEEKIVFEENLVNIITIENRCFFRQLVEMMFSQTEGGNGEFNLSHDNENISFKDKVCIIDNPLRVNINDKRIISKLYKKLEKSFLDSEFVLKYNEIMSQIELFLYDVIDFYDYDVIVDTDIEFNQLLKFTNTKINQDKHDNVMKIYDYLKIISDLEIFELIIFVNLPAYMTEEEILLLYEFCWYNKINILLVESQDRKLLNGERKIITDDDLCEIIVK